MKEKNIQISTQLKLSQESLKERNSIYILTREIKKN